MKKDKFDVARLEKHERLLKSIVNAIDDMDYMLKEKGVYSWSNENIPLERCKKIVESLKY